MIKKMFAVLISLFMVISTDFLTLNATESAPERTASGSPEIPLTVTFRQETARTMLSMINEFRTGDEAWAWNEDNSEKIYYTGLSELVYDYELEKAAMQRAAEIVLSFAHSRPDGSSCWTAYPDAFEYGWKGENIAYGYSSASSVFVAWREDNDPYAGQGHRRNMLNSNFASVGIGCAEYKGRLYWVQEFSSLKVSQNPVTYEETPVDVNVPVSEEDGQLEVSFKDAAYQNDPTVVLKEGESIDLPEASAAFRYQGSLFKNLGAVTDIENSDPSAVSIENGKLTALKQGRSELTYSASFGDFTASVTLNVQVGEHVHDYRLSGWEWTADYTAAKAVFVCASDSSHTMELDAKIASETKAPSCESEGETIYTASVTYEGTEYTDVKTVTIPAIGHHEYGEPEYTWSNDLSTVTAKAVCTVCGEEITETVRTSYEVIKEAGCETEGEGLYKAVFENAVFSEQTRSVVIESTGHEYVYQQITWAEDYSSARAVFVCSHDSSHIMELDAKITSETKAPSCESEGETVYTASVTYEGTEYTDVKTVTIPAIGHHDYGEPEYTWSNDLSTVTAKAVCTVCGEEVIETVYTTNEVIKEATETEEGTRRYTAEFTNELFETQTKDVVIPAAGSGSDIVRIWFTEDEYTMKAGKTMVLIAHTDPVHTTDTITFTSSDSSVVSNESNLLTAHKAGRATITATASNGVSASCTIKVDFADVSDPKKFFYDPVYWAFNHEPQITKGTDDTTFSPNDLCTRGHIVTFLYRAAGEPEVSGEMPFKDVKKGKFYYNAVLWALENKITQGTTETTFSPNEICTRGHIVTFLYRYLNSPAVSGSVPFTDVKKGKFYYDPVLWAVQNNITTGTTETTFSPNDSCTRGQAVTFLYRAVN